MALRVQSNEWPDLLEMRTASEWVFPRKIEHQIVEPPAQLWHVGEARDPLGSERIRQGPKEPVTKRPKMIEVGLKLFESHLFQHLAAYQQISGQRDVAVHHIQGGADVRLQHWIDVGGGNAQARATQIGRHEPVAQPVLNCQLRAH
jgi:hypothetical protein